LIDMMHRFRRFALESISGTPLEPAARRLYARLARTRGAQYDRETSLVMQRCLRHHSSAIDVGCYRGEILREMLRLAPGGTHFAFEPVPANYAYLAQQFPAVRVFPLALADYRGEATFHHAVGRPARSGLRRVHYPDAHQEVLEIKVQVDTLDHVIPAGVTIAFIKIDVEGAESLVLRGGRELIRRCRPAIVFEYGREGVEFYGTRPEQLYELLGGELGLNLSTMARWLAGQAPFDGAEFARDCEARQDFYFMAYPDD
jgi:FkbM family methyltransferase